MSSNDKADKAEKEFGPGQVPTPGRSAAEQREQYVEALKVERAGYADRGMTDRVEAVDAELARFEEKPKGRRKPSSGEQA
jgi:hypothetical protein